MHSGISLFRNELKVATVIHTTNSCGVVRQHISYKSSVGCDIVASSYCEEALVICDAKSPVPELNDTKYRM